MRVYIETAGCSLNHADSETIAGALLAAGNQLVADEGAADVVLYNTCTVKSPTEQSFLARLAKQRKPVVVAGCIPQADRSAALDGYVTLGTEQLQRAPQAVAAALAGTPFSALERSSERRLNVAKVRRKPHVEIVPILKGCLSSCTYCKTKHARGTLSSYRPSDIEEQVRTAVDDGVKEVWLTSQDNATYGMDIKTNCAELLARIARVDGDFMVRFGMANPDWIRKWLEPLIEAYKHPRVYRFLHLPIQSGSDAVLKHMGRRCTADDIRTIVRRFREEIPDITIATDIICGYPTETEDDFERTLALVSELRFPIVHISKFYPRPDTPAAALDKLPTDTVKGRSRRLTRLFESEPFATQHEPLVGSVVDVLFSERVGTTNVGRSANYTQVLVRSGDDLRGSRRKVLIERVTRDDLRGSLKP